MAPIKVCAIQAASIAYDLHASLDKLAALVKEAAQGGAQLAVLPEAFLSCYPRKLGFAIGARTDEDRQWFKRYVESSVKCPGDAEGSDWLAKHEPVEVDSEFWAFSRICTIAKENKIHLSLGIIERALIGATLYCTNILVSPQGILLSKHRKLQPTAAERVVWGQGHAFNEPNRTSNLPVVSTPLGKVGGLICWENFAPLYRYALYQQGVEIYTAPTADGRPTWTPLCQTIAQEGRCFVVSANQYHGPTDFPEAYPPIVSGTSGAKTEDVWCRGGSCIVSPLGEILAGPLWDKEGLIYADIDVGDTISSKLDFDPIGHYSRSDLFDFAVRPTSA